MPPQMNLGQSFGNTNAATETLQIYADIWGGGFSSDPSYLTVFNDKLYFAANNGDKGSEIWSLAACLNLFVTTNPQNGPDPNGSIDLTVEGGTPPTPFPGLPELAPKMLLTSSRAVTPSPSPTTWAASRPSPLR
jgi:hypothetical protein